MASLDKLTGAYRRRPGLLELEREIARSVRTGTQLAVAFVDVHGLKSVNDNHAAGDRLLEQVTDTLRAGLRPYDVVIRYSADEFVCVMSGLDAAAATRRLAGVNNKLKAAAGHGSMTIGVSDLRPEDSAADLVRRADESLSIVRQRRSRPPDPSVIGKQRSS